MCVSVSWSARSPARRSFLLSFQRPQPAANSLRAGDTRTPARPSAAAATTATSCSGTVRGTTRQTATTPAPAANRARTRSSALLRVHVHRAPWTTSPSRLWFNLFRNLLAWAFAEEAVCIQCGVIRSPCTARSLARSHARRQSFEVFLRVFLCPSTVAAAQSLSLSFSLVAALYSSCTPTTAAAPTVGRQFSRKVTDK